VSNKIKKPKKGSQGPAWAAKATDYDKTSLITPQILVRSFRLLEGWSFWGPAKRRRVRLLVHARWDPLERKAAEQFGWKLLV